MTKYEFEHLAELETPLKEEDWKLIEFVYMWHPSIGNVSGKRQISEIYKVGGIDLIRDMRNAAQINFEYEKKVEAKLMKIRELNEEIEQLREEAEEKLNNR